MGRSRAKCRRISIHKRNDDGGIAILSGVSFVDRGSEISFIVVCSKVMRRIRQEPFREFSRGKHENAASIYSLDPSCCAVCCYAECQGA